MGRDHPVAFFALIPDQQGVGLFCWLKPEGISATDGHEGADVELLDRVVVQHPVLRFVFGDGHQIGMPVAKGVVDLIKHRPQPLVLAVAEPDRDRVEGVTHDPWHAQDLDAPAFEVDVGLGQFVPAIAELNNLNSRFPKSTFRDRALYQLGVGYQATFRSSVLELRLRRRGLELGKALSGASDPITLRFQ